MNLSRNQYIGLEFLGHLVRELRRRNRTWKQTSKPRTFEGKEHEDEEVEWMLREIAEKLANMVEPS